MLGQRVRTSSTRGVSLVLLAISLVAIMGMAALALDVGMLLKVRAEAQRAADAAALAGASAFVVDQPRAVQEALAVSRAKQLADTNYMAGAKIDTSSEVAVQVLWDSSKVRVKVRRASVPVWFAQVFGWKAVPVGAVAAATALGAGTMKCVLPLVFPDYWDENNSDTNNNYWPEETLGKVKGENWAWNDVPGTPDCYWRSGDKGPDPLDPAATGCTPTGLGTDLRNNLELTSGAKYYRDVGRPIVLKPSGGAAPFAPSWYNLWDMPGGNSGGSDIRKRIRACDPTQKISLGDTYSSKPGSTTGPVDQGFTDRITSQDPTNARWVETDTLGGFKTGHVETDANKDWRDSPKVILVPLAHPKYLANGRTDIQFNTFAYFWIEAVNKDVTVRFIGPASGGLGGSTTGPLLKVIRLVE